MILSFEVSEFSELSFMNLKTSLLSAFAYIQYGSKHEIPYPLVSIWSAASLPC